MDPFPGMTFPTDPDVDHSPRLVVTMWVFWSVAFIIVAIRLFSAVTVVRKLRLSEYIMIAALLLATAQGVLFTMAARWGLGRHYWYLNPTQQIQAVKWHFLGQGIAILATSFGRISCAVFLFDFVQQYRRHKWPLLVAMGAETFITSAMLIIFLGGCGAHMNIFWEFDIPGAKLYCWSPNILVGFMYAQCAVNSLVDLYLAILPAFIFWRLQISLLQKIGLIALFSLGIFAFASSIVKVVLIFQAGVFLDYTYTIIVYEVWAATEAYIIIICGSCPMLVPFIRWAKQKTTKQRPSAPEDNGKRSDSSGQVSLENQNCRRIDDIKDLELQVGA